MPVARPESSDSRVIAHVDMDCFYVQVEQRKQPSLRGQPTAVVQYNSWKGGGLIAVSYEARKYGVKRSMRGDDAKQVCPEIQLVQVPIARGKADLSIYRNAGSEVVSILARKGRCERASIDEVYLDLTEAAKTMLAETPFDSLEVVSDEATESHVLGLDMDGSEAGDEVRKWLLGTDTDHRDKLLSCGAIIVAELRLQVLKETEFTCSAGIAHNKMLAKLASGMNKPAQQTVVPFSSVKKLLEHLPIKKMKQLGGKLGTSLQIDLGVNTVSDLLKFSEEKLQEHYGVNTGTWLWNSARGINGEEVEGRILSKSHGSGKTFPGPRALKTVDAVEKWLKELCEELSERLESDLEKNKRIASTLTLHASAYRSNDSDSFKKFPSKSCPLRYGTVKIQEDATNLFRAGLREYLGTYKVASGSRFDGWGITGLSISASKIVAIPTGTRSIMNYFHSKEQSCSLIEQSSGEFIQETEQPSLSEPEINTLVEGKRSKYTMTELGLYEVGDAISENKREHGSMEEAQAMSSSGAQGGSVDRNRKESGLEIVAGETLHSVNFKEQKAKSSKEKGNYSLLRFFHNGSAPLEKQQHASTCQETDAPSSSGNALSEAARGLSTTRSLSSHPNESVWGYNVNEIDPEVLNELPLEIQDEVRGWIRPQKRPNHFKSSGISQYFIPKKQS